MHLAFNLPQNLSEIKLTLSPVDTTKHEYKYITILKHQDCNILIDVGIYSDTLVLISPKL